jgi:ABC-type antimicrobial peptide transport system permease subunit
LDNEIIISTALTNQLNVSKGSTIKLSWLSIISNSWQQISKDFTVAGIIDINKIPKEFDQTKNIPGIGDADNCLDWQTDFPIDMDKIKSEDEIYWTEHKGLPKAFISYNTALDMWQHGLGNASGIIGNFDDDKKLTDIIVSNTGLLTFTPIYDIGHKALKNSTNFSQLFIGLSFTLIGTAIFFSLTLLSAYLNKRRKDIGVFIAIGYSHKLITKLIQTEILVMIFLGILIGLPIGILYSKLLLIGISSIWSGAFSSEQIIFNLKLSSIFLTVILSAIPLYIFSSIAIKRLVKSTTVSLLKMNHKEHPKRQFKLICIAIISLILTGVTTIISFSNKQEIFSFISGILFLPTLIIIIAIILQKMNKMPFTIKQLGLKNAYQNQNKTLRYITSIAFATFMIIAIGGYKTNINMSDSNNSSNAGFDLILKTAVPITNITKNNKIKQLIDNKDISVMPIKTDDRSEADCSNVYNVTLPTIFGVPTSTLINMDAFKFKKHLPLTPADTSPWSLLNYDLGENIIPAFADYNVLQWSLQLQIGDTLEYVTNDKTYKIKFVGALDRTIFQGGIIISKENFVKIAPSIQGYTTFFINSNPDSTKTNCSRVATARKNLQDNLPLGQTIQNALNAYGPQIETTENYLREMAKTQDSYLAIFMALGYIALLIGLAGTNIIFLKNIEDNTSTIIFLKEIGYSPKLIQSIIAKENLLITFTGIITGTLAAFIALIHTLSTLSWIIFTLLILSLLSFTLLLHNIISKRTNKIK